MDVSEIISVNVTVQDASVSQAGFGTIAIFSADGPGVPGSWQGTYSANPAGLAQMVTDGFGATRSTYLKASAICNQSPRVSQFKVYKRATPNVQSLTVKVTNITQNYVQKFDIGYLGGAMTTISRPNGFGETATQIATALELLIEAVTGISSNAATDTITITQETPGNDRFYVKNVKRELVLDDPSPDAGIATDLANAAIEDPDFFAFVIDSTSAAEITAAATWAEANKRMFHALSCDSDIVATGSADVASALKTSNLNFTTVAFTRDTRGGLDAGILGRQLSQAPGSSSWHAKTISGPAVDNLTKSESDFARGKNALTYQNVKGLSWVIDGKAASGRFLDITIGIEWLKARIAERIVFLMATLEKIPFTNAGIGLVEAEVRAQLGAAESAGLIDTGWTVTAPKASDVSPTDRANRLLPNIKFAARLQGAVHKVQIDGTVSV